jgi:hypothetical protein
VSCLRGSLTDRHGYLAYLIRDCLQFPSVAMDAMISYASCVSVAFVAWHCDQLYLVPVDPARTGQA